MHDKPNNTEREKKSKFESNDERKKKKIIMGELKRNERYCLIRCE